MTAEIDKKKRRKPIQPSTIHETSIGGKDTNPSSPTDGGDEERIDTENESDNSEGQVGREEPADENERPSPKGISPDDAPGEAYLKQTPATEEAEPTNELDKIQILDLHSDHPIVSYRNHTFSCSWAENIGTEFLFTKRNPNSTLPALRSLPGDVDLLAASSARLISNSATLVPKDRPREDKLPEKLVPRRANFVLPVGHGAGPARRKQGNFLERMQDIKLRKNESDEVTVYTTKRQTNKDWYNEIRSNWEIERTQVQKEMEKGKLTREEGLAKLEEISKVEAELEGHSASNAVRGKRKRSGVEDGTPEPVKRARGAAHGRRGSRGRARRARGSRGRGKKPIVEASESPDPEDTQAILSTPTPQTWDDLEQDKESDPTIDDLLD